MKPANRIRNLIWAVPVGLQLSLVYAVLVAATLALLGWALYAQLDSFLVKNTGERVERAVQPVLLHRLPPEPSLEQIGPFLRRELSRPDVAVAVLNAQGQFVSYTQAQSGDEPGAMPALPQGWEDKVKDGSAQWVINAPGSERQLLVLTPLAVRGPNGGAGTRLLIEQVTSLAAADAILNQLRLYIVLGIVVGTLVGIMAGLALTRAILWPLERMVRTAEAIAGGDLDRRLRLPPGRNEVARLGTSFDHMVDRLGAGLEAQRRFVADASHELRTPLTSMEGLSEMLLIGADQGDARVVQRTVRSMHKELGRLGRLVTDLLTLSRLDSTTPMMLKSIDVDHLVAEVAEQMGPLAEAKQVRLVAECQSPTVVCGDPDKLKQVILNLVDNALRYTPPGGEVRLSARGDAAASTVHIEVADTGTGVAPEDLPRIFDRFYRGDASRARASGNTGLGLAIARAIVQAHRGRIEVESTSGSGARFTVSLPAEESVDQSAPQPIARRIVGTRG